VTHYRIDELAQAAGMTVRNVRVYQDRGLLPPPRREGRVGLYSDAHLARLRLVGGLLERGYGFTHIGELISAWERGRGIDDVLGLEEVLASPWTDEIPGYLSRDELDGMFGAESADAAVDRATRLGLVVPDPPIAPGTPASSATRFRVPSPRLLHAGAELVAAGIPLVAVLDLAEAVQCDIGVVARRLVDLVATHILSAHEPGWVPSADELPEIVELVSRLRPLAQMAVDGFLASAMEDAVRSVLGERFLTSLASVAPEASSAS
jgi:DNA-binding transcriptional MerR regulator